MKWLSIVSTLFGGCLVLLGGLWLLQGLGIVRIEPIACVGACQAITGPNTTWQLLGVAAVVSGVAMIVASVSGGRRRIRGRRADR